MSRFHAIMAQQDQLFAADHDHQQHIEQQYALAQDDLYSWDTEVQAVLEGAAHAASRPSPDPPGGDAGFGEAPPDGSPSAAGNGAASAAAAVPSRRPNLEHVSAASVGDARSTTTTGSDVEGVVQIVRPEDDQPLRRFVMRSSSFSKEDFEKLLEHQGLFNVAMASDPRMAKSHLPPSKLEPPAARGIGRSRRCRNYSIMRLPMVRPDNSWVMMWSTLVLLSDLSYSAFIVPISIGMWTSFYKPNWTTISDFLFGAIFFSDIFLSLHIGFIATYNTRKLLVMNGRLVARQYLLSFSFFVDFCASIAWFAQIVMIILYNSIDTFDPKTALIAMEGIRLIRFLRVIRLLTQLVSNGMYATLVMESPYLKWLRNQTFLNMAYLVYLIAVVVNFLGSLWNFVAGAESWENSWVNYYEPFVRTYAADPSAIELTRDEALEVNRAWLWLVGNYWALTTVATVGYGDVVASNAGEACVAMCVMVIGVMFFGLVISSISELLQQANRQARRVNMFRSKMQSVERWMHQQALPAKLRRRIKTFYAEVWIRQHEVKEETVLFQELPHVLRNEVAWQACRRKFRRLPLLRELDDKTLYLLASKMTPFRFAPGHDLVTEGDPADRFWLLLEGEVVALYQYREAERLEGPAVVGESVLLQEHEEALKTYPCTYRTLTGCSCWMVRCRDFKPMLRPAVQKLVKARALQSLADRMHKYPQMWEDKALRRLRTGANDPSVSRAASVTGAMFGQSQEGEDEEAAAGAAAIRNRLARASAPAGAAHRRAVSWGDNGQQLRFSPSTHRGGSPSRLGPTASASFPWQDVAAAGAGGAADAGTPASSARPQQQQHQQEQQQQQGTASAATGPRPPLLVRLSAGARLGSGSLPPVAEGRPVQLDAGFQEQQQQQQQQQTVSVSDESPGGDVPAASAPPVRAAATSAAPAMSAERDGSPHDHEPLRSVMVMAEHGAAAAGRGLSLGAAAVVTTAAAAAKRGLLYTMVNAEEQAADGEELDEDLAPSGLMQAAEGDKSMLRLPTQHALAMLDRAVEEQEHEAAAAVAAAAAAASADASGSVRQAQLLAAVLAEVQGLRRDVDTIKRRTSLT